jgi:hypothetical protein
LPSRGRRCGPERAGGAEGDLPPASLPCRSSGRVPLSCGEFPKLRIRWSISDFPEARETPCALFSAAKAGEVKGAEASARLSRSPHWVWAAVDPVTKPLLAIDVGDRTLTMAPCLVHQVVQVLAPGCVPLFLTDGFKEYTTALLTHFGHWVQPPRRQTAGPAPKPRWMPLPTLCYAQGKYSANP